MKKRILTTLVFCGISAFMVSCGSSSNSVSSDNTSPISAEETVAFDIEAYKKQVNECATSMNTSAVLYGNIGSYMYNYFKALGYVKEIESGYEWLEKQDGGCSKEELENGYEDVRNMYKDISITEIDGKEATIIEESIKAMYENYETIVNCVQSPTGSVSTYGSELSDAINGFSSAYDELNLYLE